MTIENNLKIPKDANVLTICNMGLVSSPELANIFQGEGYTSVDYGGVHPDFDAYLKNLQYGKATPFYVNGREPKKVDQSMIEKAEFIVSVDRMATNFMYIMHQLRGNQNLIQLNVHDTIIGRVHKSEDEIIGELREQIQPYLIL